MARVDFKRVKFFSKQSGYIIAELNAGDPESPSQSYYTTLTVLRTQNGGKDWVVRSTLKAPGFIQMQFLSETEWWIKTGPDRWWAEGDSGRLFHTTDSGDRWTVVKFPRDHVGADIMVFINKKTAWLFSASDVFRAPNLFTLDGGLTWTPREVRYNE